MKIKCINNLYQENCVTVGKIYNVIDSDINSYEIKDDCGDMVYYRKSRFEVVEEKELECKVAPKSFIHKKICEELNDIYEKKNSDYGDSFGKSFVEYGMAMPCIRLEDKLLRLKSLTVNKKDQQVNDESIEDTLLDLANYAIMSLIEMRGNKNEE